MTEEKFIEQNKAAWEKLENYNRLLSHKTLPALEETQIREFADLFQRAARRLAFAKTHFPHGKSVIYLNQLVGNAHPLFYKREKSGLYGVVDYFTKDFPAAVREKRLYFAVAMMLFLIGTLVSLLMILMDKQYAVLFLPESYIQNVHVGTGGAEVDYSVMSAVIMTNNIRVAFSAMALGVTAGLGTVYILLYNGAVIGSLVGLLSARQADMTAFWALILPHGILELTAIFLAGAAGLIIGRSLLIPGDLKRRDALIKGAKEAAFFLPGICVLLILAGLIEGFFTPLPLSSWMKLGFAGLTLLLIISYFGRRGSGLPPSEQISPLRILRTRFHKRSANG